MRGYGRPINVLARNTTCYCRVERQNLRFLFTCIPGLGHFNPMAPLAHALKNAGHDVAFATAPCFAEVVTRAGLECISAGMDWDEQRLLETVPELRPVTKMYRGEWMMNNIFLDRSPRQMIPDLLTIIAAWRPDLIIAGSLEFGGALAAEKRACPTPGVTTRFGGTAGCCNMQ